MMMGNRLLVPPPQVLVHASNFPYSHSHGTVECYIPKRFFATIILVKCMHYCKRASAASGMECARVLRNYSYGMVAPVEI